jgi:hypothetical protein
LTVNPTSKVSHFTPAFLRFDLIVLSYDEGSETVGAFWYTVFIDVQSSIMCAGSRNNKYEQAVLVLLFYFTSSI